VENLAEMERFLTAVDADPSFVALVDHHSSCFVPGTASAWYQRLG
jgi:hypothetical protein